MNSIILLEDIDSIFNQRSSVGRRRRASVTFSGLLNALDGVRTQEGRILFMTTNHPENLDPALVRPGRVDLQVKLDYASFYQMEELFLRFHPTQKPLAKEFAKTLPDRKVSMAAL
jgi:chaperone BCS1